MENDFAGGRDGLSERGVSSDLYWITKQAEIGENDEWCMGRINDIVRIEGRSAVVTAEKHLSTRTLETCAPTGQIRPRQPLGSREGREHFGVRVESCDTVVRAHPQIAAFIFQDAAHRIARKAVLLCPGTEPTRQRIESIQPILSAHPNCA